MYYLSKNGQCHSLPVGCRKTCDETAFSQNMICHSHAVGHGKACDETSFIVCSHPLATDCRNRFDETAGFHKRQCNVTDLLLLQGKDVRTALIECAMSLTSCWT